VQDVQASARRGAKPTECQGDLYPDPDPDPHPHPHPPPNPNQARRQSNAKGTLSFAQASQKNTRQTQVFINLADNGGVPSFLDGPFPLGQEFAPFARVVGGMELLPKLHGEASVDQGKAAYYGEEYLDEVFPKLSVIEDVKLIL